MTSKERPGPAQSASITVESVLTARERNRLFPPRRLDKTEVVPVIGVTVARGDLLTGLLGKPFVEHLAREADVPPDPAAWQPAAPHSLIDPARLDVEIPSGLLGTKGPIL